MHVRAPVCLAAFALLASAPTLAAPPAAPDVTAGAENRQLIFDWDAVAGASSYQLWFKMDLNAAFTAVGSPIGAPQHRARVNISVHKLNWTQARYKVSACNGDGCTDSPALGVQGLMLDAIGYFKASNTGTDTSSAVASRSVQTARRSSSARRTRTAPPRA